MAQRRGLIAGFCGLALTVQVTAALAQDDSFSKAQAAVRSHDYAAAAQLLSDPDLGQNAQAQMLRASLYRMGLGVPVDDAKVFALTLSAAELGLADAAYSLGQLYLDGRGTAPDRAAAVVWLEVAAGQGHEKAAALLVELALAPAPPAPAQTPAPLPEPAPQSKLAIDNGWTPLMEAARRDALNVVSEILQAGTDLEARDKAGRTALIHAAQSGSAKSASALLRAGAVADASDSAGQTALGAAAAAAQPALVVLLLEAGAQPLVVDGQGQTPLDRAFEAQDCASAEALLAHARGLELEPAHLATLAGQAVILCPGSVLELFADRGLDLTWADPQGRAPLWQAAAAGNVAAIGYLLQAGADASAPDLAMVTPLLAAASRGQILSVAPLLQAGAAVDAASEEGNTALLLFAKAGKPEAVTLLIAAGADIDHRNALGESALMLAARAGQAEVIQTLLAAGADSKLRNLRRERAADIAISSGHRDLVALFQ